MTALLRNIKPAHVRRVALMLALLLTAPARAQDTRADLFQRVQPGRVVLVTAADGMGTNEREWGGAVAQNVAATLRTFAGEYVGKDRIQPYTWDFDGWQGRAYTPLAFMVSVREDWMQGGVLYQHYTTLSCYEVGDALVYDCYHFQGSAGDRLMGWHYNSLQIKRTDATQMLDMLFKR